MADLSRYSDMQLLSMAKVPPSKYTDAFLHHLHTQGPEKPFQKQSYSTLNFQKYDPSNAQAQKQIGSSAAGVVMPNNPYRAEAEQQVVNNVVQAMTDPMIAGPVKVGKGFHPQTAEYFNRTLNKLDERFPVGNFKLLADKTTGNMEHVNWGGDFVPELRMNPSLAKWNPETLDRIYTGWAEKTGTLPGLDATAHHEFGHLLNSQIIQKLDDAGKEAHWNTLKRLESELGMPSQYASKATHEWLSEQFAKELQDGTKGGLVDYLQQMSDTHLKGPQ